MSKRRAHRKSRDGCAECKRRHIKCDEGKPSCSHCTRYKMHCTYRQSSTISREVSSCEGLSPQSASSWQSIRTDEYSHASPGFTSAPRDAPTSLFGIKDMALFYHWITVAGHSIVDTHDINHFWHSVIPSLGFKHPYVMHNILSLSALHKAHMNPLESGDFVRVAAEHRSKALDGFIEDLHDVGPHNSSALFANATLTFFHAFVSFSKTVDDAHTDAKVRTARILGVEWVPLLRGTAIVLEPVYDHVREGPLKSFLDLYHYDHDRTEHGQASDYGVQLMKIQSLWSTDEYADTYNETLQLLLRCSTWMEKFRNMENDVMADCGYNRLCSGPFIWIFSAPEKYINLQQQRQPPALIIFAYYGVLLHQLNSYWWAEDCGRSIISAVDACLGPYWSSWVEWPKQVAGL
ncbi:hypothetical protein C7974DRAFT_429459 [Boeremia exigua]|uniref:uncharacterized protein n=1 Tax=Boeremia exigua TaxID=749465 RepID=UPI001E8DE33E|nr:uncharacterized protein C7974DRAFT_429459 [Boeremia exigua]KAH6612053.1 hypothetical protein C7974DRAFT_429459 [Boeremia exigua]